jgi:hypothetical protein
MFLNGRTVFLCSISFVLIPAIMRKFFMQLLHIRIAVCFGENTCGGNGCIDTIAFYMIQWWRTSLYVTNRFPSINNKRGWGLSCSIARCMALKEARKILIWSISVLSTWQQPRQWRMLRSLRASISLSLAITCLLSFSNG